MISGSEEKEFYYNDQSIAFVSLFCDLPLSLSAKLEIAKSVYLDFGFEACLYEKKGCDSFGTSSFTYYGGSYV